MKAGSAALADAGPLEPARPEDAVEVARILGAWGVRGELKVRPLAADPQALFSSKRWYLAPPETTYGPVRGVGFRWPSLLRVVGARSQGDCVVASVHNIADRDAAEALKGGRIFVSRASFPTPDEDEFYWVDLIGLAVTNRQGDSLGSVVGLIETGPHCVLRIQPQESARPEVLIPFVDAYIDKVEMSARLISVDWGAED